MRYHERIAQIALLSLAVCTAAHAAQRTFVASNGLDSHPCTLAAPCRSFATAIAHTSAGGEVIVLDSAGYGAATITQSVSIIAPPGIYAGISVFTGDGITINGSGISVALRGLTINGQGGDNGISVVNAGEVNVEGCLVTHMAFRGLYLQGGSVLMVKDSIFRDNGSSGIAQFAGLAAYDNVRSDRNGGSGLQLFGGGTASISRSTLIQNGSEGLDVSGGRVTVDTTTIHANLDAGVNVDPGAVWLNRSVVNRNGITGLWARNGGSIVVNDSQISDNAFLGPAPDVAVSGANSQVLLRHSVVDSPSSGQPVEIGPGAVVYSFGDNAFAPPAGGLTAQSLQ